MISKGRRIADIPSIVKLRRDVQGMRALLLLRPLWNLLGFKVKDELLGQVKSLVRQVDESASLPDRFNDLFSDRGWIAYELLSQELVKKTVKLGEEGDVDAAEQLLVEHYTPQQVEQSLRWLWAVEAFRPRERLARLALEDYAAGRYHACVPVVLMIVDGLVNDVDKSKGFAADGLDLTAWDSIAAHNRGLQHLHDQWMKGRRKTTTEPLAQPYRHGILHGRDLGYDTKIVAAKSWAFLFALRGWALKVRDGRLGPPSPKPQASWIDILKRHQETQRARTQLDAWKPRRPEILTASLITEPVDGTPEHAVAQLLHWWQRRNFGYMVPLLHSPFENRPLGERAKALREPLAGKELLGFHFVEIVDSAPAITLCRLQLEYRKCDNPQQTKLVELRCIYCDQQGQPLVRGATAGKWTVSGIEPAGWQL